MRTSARRVLLGMCAALAASGGLASAAQADTTYPVNANEFTNGAEGWEDASRSCSLLGAIPLPIPLLCESANTHDPGRGNPPGSLRSEFQAVANIGGLLFTGEAVWRSPLFEITREPRGGFFTLDRRAMVQALIESGGEATYTVTLTDESLPADNTSRTRTLLTETVTADDDRWETRSVEIPSGVLVRNHSYRLQITTEFTTTAIQLAQGTVAINYDNVGVRVFDDNDAGQVKPTVQTLVATEVTSSTANLNALVNPKGSNTTVKFEVTGTGIDGTRTVDASPLGEETTGVRVTVPIDGLSPCGTYRYRAIAQNVHGTTDGNESEFETTCAPQVETLPAAPVGVNEAGLNSSVRPNGEETTYRYQLSLAPDMSNAVMTPERAAGNSRTPQQPLTEPVSGLRADSTFYYRVLAQNALGNVAGAVVPFRTGKPTGPGPAGPPGAPGARGPSGVNRTDTTVRSGSRSLLRIRQSTVSVGLRGRRAGQIRFRIFCSARTGRTCAGTVKLRTLGKLNPSIHGRKVKKRKVTFATFEYQLQHGKAGVAIGNMEPEKVDLLRLRRGLGRTIGVRISVQVTDASGNRQTVVRNGKLRLVASPR